jgi:hypothetical protein
MMMKSVSGSIAVSRRNEGEVLNRCFKYREDAMDQFHAKTAITLGLDTYMYCSFVTRRTR